MGKLSNFASRRPLLFVVLLILCSLVAVSVAANVAVLFTEDMTSPLLGLLGSLGGVLFLILVLRHFGWLKSSGVGSLGSWKGWLVAVVLLAYYVLELMYSFFGEFSFSVPSEAVRGLELPTVFAGALYEEILFRGAVLVALVYVWGKTRRGILLSAVVSSLLFALVHSLNAIGGDPAEVPGQIAIALFEGIWWAAIVLRWGSVWPTVLIHVLSNWMLQTKALAYEDFHGTASSYGLAVALGLPLTALGVWLILKGDHETGEEKPNASTHHGH
jgi:membrane protease YdiL (CAAX protease family)